MEEFGLKSRIENDISLSWYLNAFINMGKDDNIQWLPNGSVYLANNEYNVNIIIELLQVLQFIDNISQNEEDEDNKFKLTNEAVAKINEIVKDAENRVYDLKNNLEQSLKIVNSLKFDLIHTLLKGGQLNGNNNLEAKVMQCEYCNKNIKTGKGGYEKHLKSCVKYALHLNDIKPV